MIVKRELLDKEEEDKVDCQILSVQPALVGFKLKLKLKKEKTDTKYDEAENKQPEQKKEEESREHEGDEGASNAATENNQDKLEKEIEEAMAEDDESKNVDVVNTPKKTGQRGKKKNQNVAPP